MGKYEALYTDVYSVFAGIEWVSTGIKAFPDNYTNSAGLSEFIRISIIASGSSLVNPPRSASGQIIIDIFVPIGGGTKRLNTIADMLDTYLAGKSVYTTSGGVTQLGTSSLSPLGTDSANASLFRGNYSIPFNYFGF